MKRHIRKIRKSMVTREELVADAIFLFLSAFVSFLITFFFDIHQSFYDWPFKLRFIFKTPEPYMLFVALGTFIGFFMIKLLLLGFKEEEKL